MTARRLSQDFYLARRPKPIPTTTLTLTPTPTIRGARRWQGRSRGPAACFVCIFPNQPAGRKAGLNEARGAQSVF